MFLKPCTTHFAQQQGAGDEGRVLQSHIVVVQGATPSATGAARTTGWGLRRRLFEIAESGGKLNVQNARVCTEHVAGSPMHHSVTG